MPFRDPAEAMAAGLALAGEDRQRSGLLPEASVMENLTLATSPGSGAALSRRRGARRRRAGGRGPADPDAVAFGRPAPLRRQQKGVLGKWLLARPRVFFFDEPTRGIDVASKAEIHDILGRLAAEGVAIVLVSSDLPELLSLSDRVLVLSKGRRTAMLSRSLATPEAVMAAATSGV